MQCATVFWVVLYNWLVLWCFDRMCYVFAWDWGWCRGMELEQLWIQTKPILYCLRTTVSIFTIGILNLYFQSAHLLLFLFQCSVRQYIVLPYITSFPKTADKQKLVKSALSYKIDEIANFIWNADWLLYQNYTNAALGWLPRKLIIMNKQYHNHE